MSEQDNIVESLRAAGFVATAELIVSLESQLSTLSSNYTAICDKYDTVRGEVERNDIHIAYLDGIRESQSGTIHDCFEKARQLEAELAAVRGEAEQAKADLIVSRTVSDGYFEAAQRLQSDIDLLRQERNRLREAVDDLVKDMRAVDGCFEAAYFEGWIEALADANDDRINDLYNRRIEYARHTAINAIAKHTHPQPDDQPKSTENSP